MTFMSNKLLVDSSLLVEYRKGNHLEVLDAMLAEPACELFISQTVVSEYLFHHLAIVGGKSPRTIKENGAIFSVIEQRNPVLFLDLFIWLPDDAAMLHPAVDLMAKYNLLPNDALILALCKHHDIPAIASFDPDFVIPCQGEGIHLLQTVGDFEGLLKEV